MELLPFPIELSGFTCFVMGVFFSRLGTNIVKMIVNLQICTELQKIYISKYNHEIRKTGQFNWEWEYAKGS